MPVGQGELLSVRIIMFEATWAAFMPKGMKMEDRMEKLQTNNNSHKPEKANQRRLQQSGDISG